MEYTSYHYLGGQEYNGRYQSKHLYCIRNILLWYLIISSFIYFLLFIFNIEIFNNYKTITEDKFTCILNEIVDENCPSLLINVEITDLARNDTLVLFIGNYKDCLLKYYTFEINSEFDCYLFNNNEIYINESFDYYRIQTIYNTITVFIINIILVFLMVFDYYLRKATGNCS